MEQSKTPFPGSNVFARMLLTIQYSQQIVVQS